MKFTVLSALVASAAAKNIPYTKSYDFMPINVGTTGVTTGYSMGLSITVAQQAKALTLTFALTTGIYPASNAFVAKNIYQTYVQLAGMSETGTNNNVVCNMDFTLNTFTAVNSCGVTKLNTIVKSIYSKVIGE